MKPILLKIVAIIACCLPHASNAAQYEIAVQPVLPPDQVRQSYQPLALYLSNETGHEFRIKAYRDFLTYWIKMKKGKDIDFILDAAHFTDFRVRRNDYIPLAKLPDTVSFTVITSEDSFVFDMEELISMKIATMPSPSMGAVRLNHMFPNPVRLPFFVKADNSIDAVNMVLDGSVDAAIIPSPLVGNYSNINTVTTTEPTPHMAMSASPEIPEDVREKVRQALLSASETDAGKAMLEAMNLEAFEPADASTYEGYADLLDGMFGY